MNEKPRKKVEEKENENDKKSLTKFTNKHYEHRTYWVCRMVMMNVSQSLKVAEELDQTSS